MREWFASRWFALRHPPSASDWVPPWRRHKKVCSEVFEQAFMNETLRELEGHPYCADCDYIECSPRKNRLLFWTLHVIHSIAEGE